MSRQRLVRILASVVLALSLVIPTAAFAAPNDGPGALPKGWQTFRQPDQGIAVSLPSMWFGGFMDGETFLSEFGSLFGDLAGGSDADISDLLGPLEGQDNQAQMNTMFIGLDVAATMNEDLNFVGIVTMKNPTDSKTKPLDQIMSQLEALSQTGVDEDTTFEVDKTYLSGYQCARVKVDAPYDQGESGRIMVNIYGCDQGTETGLFITATTMDSPEASQNMDTVLANLIW